MKLAFELKKIEDDEQCTLYAILRKGLQVGTISLDSDPYAHPKAKCTYMQME
jgi:hypothetical protein